MEAFEPDICLNGIAVEFGEDLFGCESCGACEQNFRALVLPAEHGGVVRAGCGVESRIRVEAMQGGVPSEREDSGGDEEAFGNLAGVHPFPQVAVVRGAIGGGGHDPLCGRRLFQKLDGASEMHGVSRC